MDREHGVSDLFVGLSRMLVSDDYDIADFLQALVEGCQEVLQVDAVGVLLEESTGRLALSAASSEDVRTLEVFQIQAQTGPCHTAYETGEQIPVVDLQEADDRWPDFVPKALEAGFRSAHAFPLRLHDDTIGALNIFSQRPGLLAEPDVHLGQSIADVATIGILSRRIVEDAELRAAQLQRALESRVSIEQAKGMLAERLEIPPGEAFQRLRAHARRNNMRLREVCRQVVDEGFTPS